MKMTIHRALAELKLIDSKIDKSINNLDVSGIYKKGKLVDGKHQKEDFEKDAKSKYQSINDLINNRQKIKSAIIKANAETIVKVGDNEMTIAEAINYKEIINKKRFLLEHLRRAHNHTLGNLNKYNETVEAQALRLAETALGKDNVKISDTDAVSITKPFIEANEYHLLDPLNAKVEIEKLEKEVDTFETEVDAVLSEINAITTIEI